MRVDAAQPDGRLARHEDDERGGELLHRAGAGQRPDAERLEHGVGGQLEGGQERQLVGPHRPDGVHPPTVACVPVRAVVCNELGPPSLLRVEERPDPAPGPGEVAVAVEAAGVNFVDGLFVGGAVPDQAAASPSCRGPRWPGGSSRSGPVSPGSRPASACWSRSGSGGFATRWSSPAAAVTALPDGSTRRGRPRSPRATAPASSPCGSGPRPSRASRCSSSAPAVASGWPPSAWPGPSGAGCSAWPRPRRSAPPRWPRGRRRCSTRRPSR